MFTDKELAQHRKYKEDGAYHRHAIRYPFSPWRVYYDISLKLLGNLTGQRCLDFGGGDGAMASLLTNKGAKVTIFDIDPLALRLSKQDNRLTQVWGRKDLPFQNGIFDIVTMLEALEHIPPELDNYALRECQRVLSAEGKLVVSVPSVKKPVNNAHYRHYSHDQLREKLETNGFKVTKVIGTHDITPQWARSGILPARAVKGLIYGMDHVYRNLNGHMGLVECSPELATKFIAHAIKAS